MAFVSPITNIVLNNEHQFKNLWELTIDDNDTDAEKLNNFGWFYNINFKFMIIETDLDFQKFDYHNFSGKHFSKGRLFDNQSFSFTIYENTQFTTMLYFEDWITKIYDVKERVFKSFRDEVEYHNVSERTFHLLFQKFHNNPYSEMFQNTMEIVLYNVKIIDRGGPITVNYVDGTPLTYKVNFVYDDYELIPNYIKG